MKKPKILIGYKILVRELLDKQEINHLTTAVISHIDDDWQPLGAPFVAGIFICQAMQLFQDEE